jgi:hypothetical protein
MSLRKRTICLAIVITLTMLTGLTHITPVTATEITDMQLVYDFGTQTLTVNVTHHSLNKNDIIETIEILKNGIFYMNRTYENQSDAWWRYDTFSVSAVVDDNLTVTATCSRDDSITRWLIVTSGTSTNTQPPDTTTPTTEPTDGTEPPPDSSLGAGIAIAAGAGVVIFLIAFFAWLNPDNIPGVFRQLGSRIRSGLSWLGKYMSNIAQQIKTKLSS